MSPSTDIATFEIIGTDLESLEAALASGKPLEIESRLQDPVEAARSIVLRILDAETDEQLTPTGATGGRQLLKVPLEIHPPLRVFPSQYEGEGPAWFVVFDAIRLDTGERVAVSTSSSNVLAALLNCIKRGRFPERKMMFVESDRPTKAGFVPLWLVPTNYKGGPE